MYPSHRTMTLERYFAGLTEQTFETRLGVADPPLIDYISGLLARFVRMDAVCQVRNLAGRPLSEVAEMMVEGEERFGDAKRAVHRHIGDFTLFWTGVYPESVPRMIRGTKDRLLDYRTQGKRAYFIASTIESAEADVPNDILQRLSHDFELCAYGLGEVRRQWEAKEPSPGEGPPPLWVDER
jgi:hypothetical protein